MPSTEPTSPPPLLQAAALLKRAAEHAAKLETDLQAAASSLRAILEHAQGAREEGHLDMLGASVRVRLLDARVAAERLPELVEELERLATAKAARAAQEGGSP